MNDNNLKIKDPLGLGLSLLLNIVISAFGAPVGPIIVALIIGVVIGCWIMNPARAGK